MSIGIAARIARRELRGGLHGFRVFLACLALGIAAIAAVGTVRSSLESGLASEGATLLGGDAEIELTYRFASAPERQWMDSISSQVSEIADFRSMASVERDCESRQGLTQVKAVDDAYPIYGNVVLAPDMSLDTALIGTGGLPGAVMDRVLVERLGLAIGEPFKIAGESFVLSAILVKEPDNATGSFTLGPRTIIGLPAARQVNLLRAGTLFETGYRLALPDGTNLDALKSAADAAIQGGGFRWHDRRNGAPGVTRFVDRLATFLIIVGLAGLIVGGVGVSASVRSYLDEKVPVIATLRTIGAEGRTVFQVYLLQIGALSGLGIAIGLVLGAGLPMILAPLIEAQLPFRAEITLVPRALAEAGVYGVLVALMFSVWPVARAENIRAATLFRDATLGLTGWPRPRYIAVSLLLLVALIAFAALFTGEARMTLWSAVGLGGAFLALAAIALLVRVLARRLSKIDFLRRFPSLHLALGAVGGPGGEAMSIVLSLGLGLTVLAGVGQMDANLRGAIARDLPKVAPLFFVVDVQPDQIEGYRTRIAEIAGVEKIRIAPMLRGVITRINGRPAAEVAGDHWVISGDRGLTYSAEQPEGTKITEGTWWPKDYTGPPQISFAAQEAEEIGLKLGDTLTINVLGRDITAEITSFRDVDFSNAGMGFVLAMNPAALAGAPHSYISTIYGKGEAEVPIMRALTRAFPNVTAINVRSAIERVGSVLKGIAAAVTLGAVVTLSTGVVVLIGAAAAGERARTYEAAILKTLGATRGVVISSFLLRSAILGAAAGGVAILAGSLSAWAVMHFVMETDYAFEPVSAFVIVGAGVAVTLLAGLAFSLRALNARPSGVLRARE